MSNDLVQCLRATTDSGARPELHRKAAARIEELEKELDTWKKCYAGARDTYIEKEQRIEELEAALREIATLQMHDMPSGHVTLLREIARRALEGKP